VLAVVIVVVAAVLPARADDNDHELTGGVRGGVYRDDDDTQVVRTLAAIKAAFGKWRLGARESVDIVSSASIDVRTSPHLDAMTSASQVAMSDRRFETTVSASHDDGRGHVLGASLVHAIESDYQSLGASLNLAWDVAARNTTLLASVGANHNWIGSTFDPSFARTLNTGSLSLGVAQVLSPTAAIRLRYDANLLDGYQASPYRYVRFGDWSVAPASRENRVLAFTNTIGDAGGLPEKLPTTRVRHAVVAEWVQSLARPVGLATQLRLAADSWGVRSLTTGVAARLLLDPWQLELGYRFYLQDGARFFHGKYTADPSMYTEYTSDKELGDERGHLATVDLRYVWDRWPGNGRTLQLDARVDVLRYSYPGFVLLPARASVLAEVGLRIDF
jgi:hypothetical protein